MQYNDSNVYRASEILSKQLEKNATQAREFEQFEPFFHTNWLTGIIEFKQEMSFSREKIDTERKEVNYTNYIIIW